MSIKEKTDLFMVNRTTVYEFINHVHNLGNFNFIFTKLHKSHFQEKISTSNISVIFLGGFIFFKIFNFIKLLFKASKQKKEIILYYS